MAHTFTRREFLRSDHLSDESGRPTASHRLVPTDPPDPMQRGSAGKVVAKGDGVDCERDGAPPRRCGWPMGIATSEAHRLMLAESLGTQEDQNKSDERLRSRALKELVRSWEDRLQLISVITTFFAATEAQLLGFTMPDDDNKSSSVQRAAVAVLVGALIVHLFSAIISFLAAFFLIQFRLGEAKRAEEKVEKNGKMSEGSVYDTHSRSSSPARIWSANPHIEQVGPFRKHGGPPDDLLENCHTMCIWLAAIGFILALAGVLCYTWARLPRSSGIFASVCMAVCCAAGLVAVLFSLCTK